VAEKMWEKENKPNGILGIEKDLAFSLVGVYNSK
jgi:hypothetical protein